jgi:hypothetical protein
MATWPASALDGLTTQTQAAQRARGVTRRVVWQKLSERNEALDCRVSAPAAAWIAGADRWGDARWRDLEEQLGIAAGPSEPTIDRGHEVPVGWRMRQHPPSAAAVRRRILALHDVTAGAAASLRPSSPHFCSESLCVNRRSQGPPRERNRDQVKSLFGRLPTCSSKRASRTPSRPPRTTPQPQTDHHHDCSGIIDEPSPVSAAPLMLYDNRGTLKIRPGQGNVGDAFAVSMVPKGPFRPAENSDSCWRVKVWSPRAGTFN